MKNIFLAFSLLFSTTIFAQMPIDQTTGKVRYEEVVPVANVSQAELYKRLDNWFNKYYVNPASVIESKDEATGKIKGKHRLDLYTKNPSGGNQIKKGQEYYSIEVIVKEGRFKYTISDIFFFNTPKIPIENWLTDKAIANEKDWAAQTHTLLTKLIEDLKKNMNQPVAVKTEDNW